MQYLSVYKYLLNELVKLKLNNINIYLFCNDSWVGTSFRQQFPNFAEH